MIRWKDKQMTVFGDPIQNRQSDSGFWSRCELSDAGKSIKLMIQFNDIESIKHMIEFKDKFGSLATNDPSFRHHPNRKTQDIRIWSKPMAYWWCKPSKVGRARESWCYWTDMGPSKSKGLALIPNLGIGCIWAASIGLIHVRTFDLGTNKRHWCKLTRLKSRQTTKDRVAMPLMTKQKKRRKQ